MKAGFSFCILLFLIFIFSNQIAFGNSDSLYTLNKKSKTAAEKTASYSNLGHHYYNTHQYDSAIYYYNTSLTFISNSDYLLQGRTARWIARSYHMNEDLTSAVFYYKQALTLFEKQDSFPELRADVLKDIGRTYYENALYDSAMTYYMRSKSIYEKHEIYDQGLGVLYHYIGSVFKRQGNMDKACEYYQMEIEYGEKHELIEIMAEGTYLYTLCLDTDLEMLRNDQKALKMYEELGDPRFIAMMHHNVALGYHSLDMLDSAFYFYSLSVEAERASGSKSNLSLSLASLASLLIDMKKYKEAKNYLIEAESLANETQVKRYVQLTQIYDVFFNLHYTQADYKNAVDYLILKYTYRDSAMDQEHQNAIQEMEIAYETEKKEAEIAKLELTNKQEQYERELAQADAQRQAANKKIFLVGGLMMMVLLLFALFKWRESYKQRAIILEQKYRVEQQKELIEEKNKDITDSMIYASSIQRAIITSEDYIRSMFSDFFVFYKPRDIVSGDFYWAYESPDGKKFIAVGDCTGHGVPGAMMSMLGSAFLNEIVIENKERDPGIILNKMRNQIKKALSNKGGKDGMDMAFCCIQNNELLFAGANLPVYIIKSDELTEIKGDKQPVGFQPTEESPFTTKSIQIQKGNKLYLFSDGYADQFGGPKGKKYKYKTFKDKLAFVAGMNFSEQRSHIDSEFETWKGDLEQLDDVCVLGIEI